ncbi:hypothetical protein J3Q64DRAFT_1833198 [Phycomyces blakesleeanus]|uniref:tRNA-splicing endonuclease subunit Sen54 N-terminal domain-containing protein n=2 Tax=Phycomyces blakesleeanus TaxID=4837 RepID=A0A167NG31_PHYB8|nr:hypothetical protein PHYBLDRAFT_142805 [Phycomyces blakesleeanus NRRL 1555(-)]OAD75814.1 hypothetical protein PHYBLDRAFT_142805 [Phycomyces blakesleeanus NRRL 1555(-)]|eukprot:XP_018293854.1 hypothetical protein PHYBLDRAFT_142805 [Phycomyces blakesleeanus NRRL 1555(-)]
MSDSDDPDVPIDFSTLLSSRQRGKQAPKRGSKESEPNESLAQKNELESSRDALFMLIGEKPKGGQKSMSHGHWSQLTHLTTITSTKGNHVHTMGHTIQGHIALYLEEAAWLISRNALEVTENDNPKLFEDFCLQMFKGADGWITYEKYQVYVYLKRLGYIVQRSNSCAIQSKAKLVVPNKTWSYYFFKIISKGNRLCYNVVNSFTSFLQRLGVIATSIKPLVWDKTCSSYADVYSTLQIIPSSPWYKPFQQRSHLFEKSVKENNIAFDWDVYRPNPKWKKRDAGVPDFRVMDTPIPPCEQFNGLFSHLEQDLCSLPHAKHLQIRNTQSPQSAPAFLMGLVDDSEGVTFLRFTGDGLADVSAVSAVSITKPIFQNK